MKEKFKQAADLIANVISWDEVECKNKTFAKELKRHSKEGKGKVIVLNRIKDLKDAEEDVNIILYLKDLKGLVDNISFFEQISKATLPTPHTYIIRKYKKP